ncbi:MipA/OmpV family protein [Meridianimarinicoccus aquatilis]|uniref:MipA/OmpV family protein n=1 Tax=Meridianimarinicoccus aquatilis TaxID=2552766 RepID=A0A4R6AYT7_9RHOB|nr:MipA/OmpV family protein [Fluviibacterium aquatile]QIE41859.1 MipA/OmpV family protein [Rhodobacteraceae bacterium SC52]TDL89430.1 MipA/OmpV family protein [Fluviibacterium aquatile]
MSMRRIAIIASALLSAGTTPAFADFDMLTFSPTYLPNYGVLAIGAVPDYIGSDEYFIGAAPAARVSWGQRYVDLTVSFMTVNLIDDPNWQAGPAGQYRFARRDVKDPVVALLPEIDGTIELGGFAAYTAAPTPNEPRDRWRISASVTADVAGRHDGYVTAVSGLRWLPVGRYSLLGLSIAASYGSENYQDTYFSITPSQSAASGLSIFDTGAGMRDVRAAAVFIQPISPEWSLGAGAIYSRIVGDTANSPVVKDRGSPDQLVFGFGAARIF